METTGTQITLRTPCALDAMRVMKQAVPEALIGAGTVTTRERLIAAKVAGADFIVSPGTTAELWAAGESEQMPILPGFSTASEAMRLMDLGFSVGKFFPAEASGGVKYLQALAGPLPEFQICPTGGITLESAPSFLACANVVCVGGSWIASADLLRQGDYSEISLRAKQAADL